MMEPMRVGRYALFDALASGGMATVHLGRLTGAAGFSRTVAIKRLHPNYAREADFVGMLVDEARLAGRIRHPNVVPTLDVVQLEGELMLVMEYVHGEALNRLLRNVIQAGETIPLPIVSAVMVAVLHGLHAAHEAKDERGVALGIVHRDISPQNVLVGIDGVSRILDFGVAKASGRIQSTGDGKLKGKLAYMAPEQLHGKDADRRVDVWAAGVVLWEILAARRLFSAESDVLVIPRVLDAVIDPPSKFVAVSPEIDAIVLRALARDADARYPTALDMALDLERAAPPATTRAVGEWLRQTAGAQFDARTAVLARVEAWEDGSGYEEGARAVLAASRPSSPSAQGISGVSSGISGILTAGTGFTKSAVVTSVASHVDPPVAPKSQKGGMRFFQGMALAFLLLATVGFFVVRQLIVAPGAGRPIGSIAAPSANSAATAAGVAAAIPSLTAPSASASHDESVHPAPTASVTVVRSAVIPIAPVPNHVQSAHIVVVTATTAIAPSVQAPPKANCDPPYTIGPAPDFIRRPKLECLN